MKLIEPRTLKGFRDYLPKEQAARNKIIAGIRKTFELYGFEPLETPALEYEDILSGKYGEEGEKLMYRFKDNGDRDVALRYDLTVPLARLVAQYQNELPKPFKRYQISPVWRAENTQKGRFREFYQCDTDVVGAEVGIADAECVAVIERVMLDLGLRKFVIKINNRKILNAIMITAGVPTEKIVDGIRAIDKIEKIGAKAVAEELQEKIGLNAHQAEGLIGLASTKVPDVGTLKAFMNEHILKQPQGQQGFDELNKVFVALKEFGVTHAEIDLSLARGLDYYTSTIIETVITENPEMRKFGSVAGGGRYDKLVNLFTGKDLPAVGVSVGLDRLFAALSEFDPEIVQSNIVQVLVINREEKLQEEYLRLVTQLRAAGINSDLYYEPVDLKKQFAYAETKSIPYAVIVGENEVKTGEVLIRDLKTREQISVPTDELLGKLKELLK